MDGSLTYPQYVNVIKGQIAYAKEIHGTLSDAAQKLSEWMSNDCEWTMSYEGIFLCDVIGNKKTIS